MKPTFSGSRLMRVFMASSALVGASQMSAAQDIRLEEIIVTARRVQENLVDVPMAITAMTAEELQRANFKDLVDLKNFTPGFSFSEQGLRGDRSSRSFRLRGLSVGGEQIFLDGAPSLAGDIGTFMDVDRVEVLRGPQAAYFGRDTYNGAINFITRIPGNEWKVSIEAEAARWATNNIAGMIEGPVITDRLSLRLGLRQEVSRGQYKNQADTSQTMGDRKTRAASVSAYITPIEDLSIKLYATAFEFDDGPASHYMFTRDQFTCNGGAGTARNWICGEIPRPDLSKLAANVEVDERIRTQLFPLSYFPGGPKSGQAGLRKYIYAVHGIVNYAFNDGWEFSAISAWDDTSSTEMHDEDNRDTLNVPNPNFGRIANVRPYYNEFVLIDDYGKDWSQEARITTPQDTSLRGTLGGSFVHFNSIPSWVTGDQATGLRIPPSSGGRNIVDAWAIFGGVYYDVLPTITLSAEARYQWDKITSVSLPPPSVTLAHTWPSFSPRVTIDYKPTEDMTIFALWARGYRPGAFNIRVLTLTPNQVAQLLALTGAGLNVEQEKFDDFEIGIKGRFFEDRAQASLTAYYGIVTNQQVGSGGVVFDDRGVPSNIGATANRGETKIKGIELEGTVQVTQELNVSFTGAINDTKLTKYICMPCVALMGSVDAATGNRLPGYAKYAGSATAFYRAELTADYDWFARAEYTYEGKKFENVYNLAWTAPRHIVNTRLGVESDMVRIEGYVTNLFANAAPLSLGTTTDRINGNVPTLIMTLPRKRTWGVRATYTF